MGAVDEKQITSTLFQADGIPKYIIFKDQNNQGNANNANENRSQSPGCCGGGGAVDCSAGGWSTVRYSVPRR